MINDGANDVPPNTIAVFRQTPQGTVLPEETVHKIFQKPNKKRDWFTPSFYRCLPLTIGNQYGFVVTSQFDFAFTWNGEDSNDAITFEFYDEFENLNKLYPIVESHFGMGIVTVTSPVTFRTPPGVNLMTINPPNYVIPNVTVMTGVVETDNLRRNFTFNLKIQMPNLKTLIPAGLPLAGFIPIPRYFGDKFELKIDTELFEEELVQEEYEAMNQALKVREEAAKINKYKVDRNYYMGVDSFGNHFKDHQGPNQ